MSRINRLACAHFRHGQGLLATTGVMSSSLIGSMLRCTIRMGLDPCFLALYPEVAVQHNLIGSDQGRAGLSPGPGRDDNCQVRWTCGCGARVTPPMFPPEKIRNCVVYAVGLRLKGGLV
jgi:hypothetical protein